MEQGDFIRGFDQEQSRYSSVGSEANPLQNIEQGAKNVFDEAKDFVSQKYQEARGDVGSEYQDVRRNLSSPINGRSNALKQLSPGLGSIVQKYRSMRNNNSNVYTPQGIIRNNTRSSSACNWILILLIILLAAFVIWKCLENRRV